MSKVVKCSSCGREIVVAGDPADQVRFDCPYCGTHPSMEDPARLGSGAHTPANPPAGEPALGAETIFHPELAMGASSQAGGTRILTPGDRAAQTPEPQLNVQAFLLVEGALPGQDRKPVTPPKTVIGRQGTDIQLPDEAISTRHLEIVAVDSDFVLRDLGSQNGTYVNGERVHSVRLSDGDRIEIGQTAMIFRSLKVVPFNP